MPQLLGKIQFCPGYDMGYASKSFLTKNLLAILRGYIFAPHIPLNEYSTTMVHPKQTRGLGGSRNL